MKKLNIESIEAFLGYLDRLYRTGEWVFKVEADGCLHLWRRYDANVFVREHAYSPLTAVYYYVTALEGRATTLHRGSFWVEELTQEYGLPWWEVLTLSYTWAKIGCGGQQYSEKLRERMLKILSDAQTDLVKAEEPALAEKVVSLARAA